MSRARGFTNTLGNAVGAMAIARAVQAVDTKVLQRELNGGQHLRLQEKRI
jgi:hypothetical protein